MFVFYLPNLFAWGLLFGSHAVLANPEELPAPTPAAIAFAPPLAWDPKPTEGPSVPHAELLKRDFVPTSGVCGWIGGNPNNPVTQVGDLGICYFNSEVSIGGVPYWTTCIEYGSAKSACVGSSCTLSQVTCSSSKPYCLTWIYPSGYLGYQCFTNSGQQVSVAWTYAGQTAPIAVPTFTGNKGISTGTQSPSLFGSSSSSSSTSSSTSATTLTTTSKSTTPTPTPPPSPTNVGAIAGGVIGGVVVICITAIAIVLIVRRKKEPSTGGTGVSAAPPPSMAAHSSSYGAPSPMTIGSPQIPLSPQVHPQQQMPYGQQMHPSQPITPPPQQGFYGSYAPKTEPDPQQQAYYGPGAGRHDSVGYPPQGYPQQGYPPQGYPPQAAPVFEAPTSPAEHK
ncbi:MAG: hypothetical protein M1813_002112 [Trichoglossum hirsutum]|nr:MAG: hypothetical protein M1813_002112 [Trichoglossum hirsutum]